jgi:hypothetical protein
VVSVRKYATSDVRKEMTFVSGIFRLLLTNIRPSFVNKCVQFALYLYVAEEGIVLRRPYVVLQTGRR